MAVDLFAGAGGFGVGFEGAGFDVQLSLEIDDWAVETLRFNYPNRNIIHGDIRDYNRIDAIEGCCRLKPDIVIGGPPCQGFSIAGPAQKDPNDPRNSLFINFAQWVEVLDPKAFVMENVKGILSRRNAEGEKVIEIITRKFEHLGYFVETWVLNAAEYGVPQIRERVFIVGHRGDQMIGPPPTTHYVGNSPRSNQLSLFHAHKKPALTLWEAISDLPPLEAGEGQEVQPYTDAPQSDYQLSAREGSAQLFNHVAMEHTKRLVERFKYIDWGESSADVPAEHLARRRNGNGAISTGIYDQNNRRLHPYKPSHTIAAAFYANFVHPFQHRNITAREGARIQSFPDTYRFLGKRTIASHKLLQRENRHDESHLCQYNQIGNAVPPLLARAIGLHLKECLGL